MKDKKIIFLDIDGTLYDHKNKHIPKKSIDALKEIHKKGKIDIAISTGRAEYMLHVIEEIRDLIDIFLLINGQIIVYKQEVIHRDYMEEDDVLNIKNILDKHNLIYGYLGEEAESINKTDKEAIEAFEAMNLKIPNQEEHFYKENKVFQMWSFCKGDLLEKIREELPEYKFVSWFTGGTDILKQGSSKANAMEIIIEKLGYKHENVYAFGDGDNDVEMLQLAHKGIAMGNASELTKKHADYVTDNIEDDGLYKALKHFDLI